MCSTSCWNGISLACMDVAKKHVTKKSHADAGKRICDYPIIQVDYKIFRTFMLNECPSFLINIFSKSQRNNELKYSRNHFSLT